MPAPPATHPWRAEPSKEKGAYLPMTETQRNGILTLARDCLRQAQEALDGLESQPVERWHHWIDEFTAAMDRSDLAMGLISLELRHQRSGLRRVAT